MIRPIVLVGFLAVLGGLGGGGGAVAAERSVCGGAVSSKPKVCEPLGVAAAESGSPITPGSGVVVRFGASDREGGLEAYTGIMPLYSYTPIYPTVTPGAVLDDVTLDPIAGPVNRQVAVLVDLVDTAGAPLPPGEYVVYVYVEDATGNTSKSIATTFTIS